MSSKSQNHGTFTDIPLQSLSPNHRDDRQPPPPSKFGTISGDTKSSQKNDNTSKDTKSSNMLTAITHPLLSAYDASRESEAVDRGQKPYDHSRAHKKDWTDKHPKTYIGSVIGSVIGLTGVFGYSCYLLVDGWQSRSNGLSNGNNCTGNGTEPTFVYFCNNQEGMETGDGKEVRCEDLSDFKIQQEDLGKSLAEIFQSRNLSRRSGAEDVVVPSSRWIEASEHGEESEEEKRGKGIASPFTA